MAKIEKKTFTGEVVEDVTPMGGPIPGRVIVKKGDDYIAVVVPINLPAPEEGDSITVEYVEEPISGGVRIANARLSPVLSVAEAKLASDRANAKAVAAKAAADKAAADAKK